MTEDQDFNKPQIWHHGLVARASAELWTDGGREAEYFKNLIKTSGQPALDLGCGAGRLLLPLLQAGLEVDGCDASQDMLDRCQERVKKAGRSTRLHAQPMHALDLPRRYCTIFCCGVVGLGVEKPLVLQGMRRCYEHLRDGGTFAFDYSPRWNDPPAWLSRLPENRRLIQEWPESGERDPLSDGSEIEMATRTIAMDPLEDVATRQFRARLWRDGDLIQEEIHTQKVWDFSKNELVLMLERAGFADIEIFGDYSAEPATADHENLIFVAKK